MSVEDDSDKPGVWASVKAFFNARANSLQEYRSEAGLEEKGVWDKVKTLFGARDTLLEETDHEPEEGNGWRRVKALFDVSDGKGPREEIQHIPTVVMTTSVFAFLFGGQFGARIAAEFYKRHNQLTVFDSAMHAQRMYQSALGVGFVKYGCRWGWRAGAFAGIYSLFLVTFEAFRNRDDALNYAASGASTGALYNITSGWRRVVVGIVVGGGLSLPVGVLAQVGNSVLPDKYKLKSREEKLAEERQQWEQQLEETSSIIQAIQQDLKVDEDEETDGKR